MTDRDSPVTEDELHAYVDGELPADRREAVTAWLAANWEAAATVATWQAQADTIRARFGAVADEPVPARLSVERILKESGTGSRSWMAVAAAAAIVAFLVGGAAGWLAHGASAAAPTVFDRFAGEALDAHKLYVVEVRHPVEVPGNERPHMTAWLTKRLGYEQRIPDLQPIGLKLIGGRLLPGPAGGPAAFYMYEGPSGERFTIYCSRSAAPETALRFKAEDRFAAFYWVDDKVFYMVSGPADRDRLENVTKAIYEQVEKNGPKRR